MDEIPGVEKRLHAFLDGQVQGVGFRMFIQEHAVRLGMRGWVRNRWDGRVEVVAEGSLEALNQLLGYLRRGPRSAHVAALDFNWQRATSEFQTFSIRRTE